MTKKPLNIMKGNVITPLLRSISKFPITAKHRFKNESVKIINSAGSQYAAVAVVPNHFYLIYATQVEIYHRNLVAMST